MKILYFFFFVGHFCPPGSGSAIWMRVRIQQLNLMRIRIRIRIRSPALNKQFVCPGCHTIVFPQFLIHSFFRFTIFFYGQMSGIFFLSLRSTCLTSPPTSAASWRPTGGFFSYWPPFLLAKDFKSVFFSQCSNVWLFAIEGRIRIHDQKYGSDCWKNC